MTTLNLRPQPFGIFPRPVSYLVLPETETPGAADALAALLRGQLPDDLPPAWRFYGLALAGDRDAALAALAEDTSPLACYNRFVLSASADTYAFRAGEPPGDLSQLYDLVAYTFGYAKLPPSPGASTGELRALIMLAWGGVALERYDLPSAEADLGMALVLARPISPVFAAQIALSLAENRSRLLGPNPISIQYLREAMSLLKGSAMRTLYAQIALNLGMQYQDLARGQRGPLLDAARCYQEALRVFSRAAYPEFYALAQSQLAIAYLAMALTEASDQLRIGVAVHALREALRVYTRELHPEQWASACLSLANALQHLPAGRPKEHLIESVRIYDDLLAFHDPAHDRVGYAHILANQANALAYLGAFARAVPKLEQARLLFAAAGDDESVATVANLLAEIGLTREVNAPAPAPVRLVRGWRL
ncbi:MAG: hypothetical protein HGA19_10340 [Oscillochloris sp.]|nr:hypothetical protein [Oscillochloris sp.]